MVSWPGALPQNQFVSLTDRIDKDPVLRTDMDTGPSSRRNRFTAFSRSIDIPTIFNGTERAIFDTFYQTDLNNGTLSFDWEDPVTDEIVSYAFRNPPEFTLIAGHSDPAGRKWQCQLNLELLP